MSTFFFPPSPTSNPLSGAVIYDPVRSGLSGQVLYNFGIGSSLHNAQLGSAAGSDTNDPTWGATGLVFGADDFLKITSAWFDDMAAFTCITACKPITAGASSAGRIFDKTNRYLYFTSTGTVKYAQIRGASTYAWDSTQQITFNNNPYILVASYDTQNPDIPPNLWINTTKNAGSFAAGSGGAACSSDSNYDLFVGNKSDATRNFDGTIYLQVWFPRVLTDAQYLRAYYYIKSLLAARGVTV